MKPQSKAPHFSKQIALAAFLFCGILSLPLFAENEDHDRRAFATPINQKWTKECSACHMLYLPGLLPKRSWTLMMKDLDNHFGENASLDSVTHEEIRMFLTENSGDSGRSRRGQKISNSIPLTETPLRISDTLYFKRKHHEISGKIYKRKAIGSAANCVACHQGAEKGNFSEEAVKIPN